MDKKKTFDKDSEEVREILLELQEEQSCSRDFIAKMNFYVNQHIKALNFDGYIRLIVIVTVGSITLISRILEIYWLSAVSIITGFFILSLSKVYARACLSKNYNGKLNTSSKVSIAIEIVYLTICLFIPGIVFAMKI